MTMPRTRVGIVAVLLLMSVTQGCTKKGIECVVLIDYSASVSHKDFDRYVQWFREGLLQHLTLDDAVTLIPIDKASESRNEVIGRTDFEVLEEKLVENIPQWNVLYEQDTVAARLAALKDTLYEDRIYELRAERSRFNVLTNIVGSINQSAGFFARTRKPHKALFIFSDMIQESDEVNLLKVKNEAEIQSIVQALKHNKRIPDLSGVVVFVSGATARSDVQFRLYKRFWDIFFEQAGTWMTDYGFDNSARIGWVLDSLRQAGS